MSQRSSVPWVTMVVLGALGGCVATTIEGPGEPSNAPPRPRQVSAVPTVRADAPASIVASHLLVTYLGSRGAPSTVTRTREEARTRAEEALRRARTGEPFGALVTEYSEEPGAAARGGSLGRFEAAQMVPEFSAAAFSLKPGEVSAVVETPFGFHVIRRDE